MKSWRGLWSLTLVALAISVYLTLVGLWQLGAVCLWCLGSLALMAAIFVALTFQRPAQAPGIPWSNWWVNRGGVAIIAVGARHFYDYLCSILSRPSDGSVLYMV